MDKLQKPGLYWDPAHHGLGCRVWKNGRDKSWVFQKSGGRRQTLGKWPNVEVRTARLKAAELNTQPSTRQATTTLLAAHAIWEENLLARGGSESTTSSRSLQLHKHCGHLLRRPIDLITKQDLLELQTALADQPHVANNVIAHLCTLIRRVADRDIRLPGIRRPEPTRARIEDIAAWWQEVKASDSVMIAPLCFAALTGLRENDIKTARRSHIEGDHLFLPKPKGGSTRAFHRHLPRQALDLIAAQPSNDVIFPVYKVRLKGVAGTHACRHHWRTVAELEAGCPFPVVQHLMNHKGGRGVTDAYGSVPREIAARWSQATADIIGEKMGL